MKTIRYWFTFVATLILVLLIISCEKDKNENPRVFTSDISGNWKVISFEDYETSTKTVKTIENTWECCKGDNTANFTMLNSKIGIVEGYNVTNSFHGDFAIDLKGKIFIYNVIWTEVGEPDWGYMFHSIEEAETYEVTNDLLIIYYNQKRNSLTLQRTDK
jgi:hypothetical protein